MSGTSAGDASRTPSAASHEIAAMDVRRLFVVALAAVCLGAATPVAADLLDYTATLDLDIGTTSEFRLDASGQIDVGRDGSFMFPAGVFVTTRTLIPLQTPSEAVASINLQLENEAGSFGGPNSPGGVMRLTGQVILNFQGFLGLPDLTIGITPLGAAGAQQSSGTASNGSTMLTATLTGTSWLTGTFQQTGVTASGSTFARRTNTGIDQRTASGEGIVTLVVPAFVTIREDGSFAEVSPITGVLRITFTPEPAPIIANITMIVVVALLGRARVRERRGPGRGTRGESREA
jgi:hypothetical protein